MPGSTPPAPLRRSQRPLWLGQPGRMTGLSPMVARAVLALLILLIAIGYATQGAFEPVGERLPPVTTTILDHVRHGQSFYPAALDALRENDRALRPALFAVPLPALFVTLAALPTLVWHGGLLLLGMAMMAGWLRRMVPVLETRTAVGLLAILLIAGFYPLPDRPMVTAPESWAAVLIALSLVQRRPEAGLSAVALGLVAMILTPMALPYAIVMLVLAAQAGARREAIGWMTALAVALLVLAAHAHALNALVSAVDPAMGSPERASFDKVIDVVGGEQVGERIAALRAGGHYAVAGAIAGPIVSVDLRTLYLRDITLHGCTYQSREVFAGLVELINDGRAKPRVSKTFPLQEIAAAQAEFQSKRNAGKIVLTMPEVLS